MKLASTAAAARTVSLGYDLPRAKVEKLLVTAAGEAGLVEPFVQIRELGDFAVTYRIAGLLTEAKNLISVRSLLRAATLDALHRGGVEIVSPSFMNTRAVPEGKTFIPPVAATPGDAESPAAAVESVAFDKAEEAEELEANRQVHRQLGEQLQAIEEQQKAAGSEAERRKLAGERDRLAAERDRLEKLFAEGDDPENDR